MAIKIQTQQTYIPIQLGDLELKFEVTDDSILALQTELTKVQKELDALDRGGSDEEKLNKSKLVLKRGFDTFFGEGTFDKVYEMSPSVMIIMEYFKQISEALFKELEKMGYRQTTQADKAKKYLANKKK